ncbi:unnamed protein product [Trichobilharzia regenti]|nr:unnamed protein product [Trichobilharzia regenti]
MNPMIPSKYGIKLGITFLTLVNQFLMIMENGLF